VSPRSRARTKRNKRKTEPPRERKREREERERRRRIAASYCKIEEDVSGRGQYITIPSVSATLCCEYVTRESNLRGGSSRSSRGASCSSEDRVTSHQALDDVANATVPAREGFGEPKDSSGSGCVSSPSECTERRTVHVYVEPSECNVNRHSSSSSRVMMGAKVGYTGCAVLRRSCIRDFPPRGRESVLRFAK